MAVAHLLNTFFDWEKQTQARAHEYYLTIWLVAPDFAHNSQVVWGRRERVTWYQDMDDEPVVDGPPLPLEYQQLPGAERLIWQPHRWEELIAEDDHPLGWPAWALKRFHHFYTTEEGARYLVVQTGWRWAGRRPATTIY
ncbi:hypothetical protein H8B15_01620 [Hymenobacter sp. BT507]|uniref:Uncharacterized protein n=1 Tax=Hymenobacter citatus TaxID=2763506 RepID=A0ABR7MEW9_9BACT|nr:hypothetical protein [Hymenobacter citatus]MBC6609600.1 hypothetical protein [Hymenobacter citatus]